MPGPLSVKDAYAEAQRRVEDARNRKASRLDLSFRYLRLLPSLHGLDHVEYLSIARSEIADISAVANLKGLQRLNAWDTLISDLSPLSELRRLRDIELTYCRGIRTIAPLAALTALEELDIWSTNIDSIEPLRDLINLTHLELAGTPIGNLEPLSKMRKLRRLIIDRTRVADLGPIAEITTLIEGAKKESRGGVSFDGCPIRDQTLLRFATMDNPERTIKTIDYLRSQAGLPLLELTEDVLDAELIAAATRSNPLGAQTVTRGDYIALAPSGEDTDLSAADAPVTKELHEQLKRRVGSIRELAQRIQNQIGWTDMASTSVAFEAVATKPLSEIAGQIGELWALSAALGGFVNQDSDARENPNSFVSPLEPDQRRILDDAVSIAAVFVRQFPTARRLDEELREFKGTADLTKSARAVIDASLKSDALLPEHGAIVRGELATPSNTRSLNAKAQGRAVATTYNVVMKSIKIGAAFVGLMGAGYATGIGEEVANHDILGKKVSEFIISGEKSLSDFLSDAPGDLKTVLREVIKRLKK